MNPLSNTIERQTAWLPAPSGIFGLVVFLLLITTQGPKLLVDGDTYTHIRCGQWMIENGHILDHDTFSHTVAGKPWMAHEWGAQVIMGWLYQHGGLPSIAIFFSWLAAISLSLFYRIAERLSSSPWLPLAITSATLILAYPHLIARPHLFTWLFGAVTLALLIWDYGRFRVLHPLLTVFWANLHGGFVLGLILQAGYLAGHCIENWRCLGFRMTLTGRRKDLLILVCSVLAALITPFGIDLLLFYFHVSAADVSAHNPEWMSPNLKTFWPYRIYLVALFLALCCARRRPSWTNLLLMVLFVDASLTHRRHISIAAMFLTPLWVELLQPHFQKASVVTANLHSQLRLSYWSGPALQTITTAVLLIGLAFAPFHCRSDFSSLFPISTRFPHQAWEWIEVNQPQGRVLNETTWGAFLIYRTAGTIPVFIDGFADKYGGQIYGDYYRIANLDMQVDDLLDSYQVDWVLFPTSSPLVRYLAATGRWQSTYTDDQASILTRKILQ
jgi:hypothetical protein